MARWGWDGDGNGMKVQWTGPVPGEGPPRSLRKGKVLSVSRRGNSDSVRNDGEIHVVREEEGTTGRSAYRSSGDIMEQYVGDKGTR